MDNSFTYYLRETYLVPFVGQFVKLEGQDASEVIKQICIVLTPVSTVTYSIHILCTTWFNQVAFTETNIPISDIENTVKQMSQDIEKQIIKPLEEFHQP